MGKSEHIYIGFCIAFFMMIVGMLVGLWQMNIASRILISAAAIMFAIGDIFNQRFIYISDLWSLSRVYRPLKSEPATLDEIKYRLRKRSRGSYGGEFLTTVHKRILPYEDDDKARHILKRTEKYRNCFFISGIIFTVIASLLVNYPLMYDTDFSLPIGDVSTMFAFICIFLCYAQRASLDGRRNQMKNIQNEITIFLNEQRKN